MESPESPKDIFEIYSHKLKARPVKKVVCYSLIAKRLRIMGNVADDRPYLGTTVKTCLCRDINWNRLGVT